MLDYKALLQKYMQHVYYSEGTDFVFGLHLLDIFTEQEVKELEAMSKELKP